MFEAVFLTWALGAVASGFLLALEAGGRKGILSSSQVDDLVEISLTWPIRVAGFVGNLVGYAIRALRRLT